MAWRCEYTDTFGGEANYSWVRRALIPAKDCGDKGEFESQAALMRRAKKALGISGLRGRVENYAEEYTFRPYGSCTIAFVTWDDWSDEAQRVDAGEAV